tara:strand:+ start:2212 stop:5973 length:3762 start_codon:yes stop_codon:yes gene_type:complete
MKGLHAYHLLNSGGFLAASCTVAGHLQLIGTNGTGKTTNLRIVSYFYNPSSKKKDHAIEESKSSFNNFHFKGESSYVIFEVCRGILSDGSPDLYHIAVSKISARIAFLFVDGPYDRNLYLDDKRILCNRREVEANLMRMGVRFESVRSYDEYRDIIYGITKQPKFQPYVFATPRPNSSRAIGTIPEILSAVFRSETMKTATLKDALVASLGVEEEDSSINLEVISRDLRKFHRIRLDIQRFQGNISSSEIAYGLYQEASRFSISNTELAYQMQTALPLARNADVLLSTNIQQTEDSILTVKRIADEKVKELKLGSKSAEGSLGEVRGKLKEIAKYEIEYPQEEMRLAGIKVDAIPKLEVSRDGLNKQLGLIVRQFDSIKSKYSSLREQEGNTVGTQLRIIETEWLEAKESIGEEIQNARSLADANLSRIDDDRDKEQASISDDVVRLTRDLTRLEGKMQSLKLDDFRKGEIGNLKNEVQETRSELAKQESMVAMAPKEIQSLEQSCKLFLNENGNVLLQTLHPIQSKKAEAVQLLDAAQRIVKQYSGSLLEFVDQSDRLDRSPFISTVNEDVLLSQSDGLIEGSGESGHSLFGLSIDIDSLPEPKRLDYESSVNEVASLSADVSSFDKEIAEHQAKAEREAKAKKDEIDVEIQKHAGARNQAQVSVENCLNDLTTLDRRLERLCQLQAEEFTQSKEELARGIAQASEELELKKQVDSTFKAETKTQKNKVKSGRAKQVLTLQEELDKKEAEKQVEVSKIELASKEAVSLINQQEQAELDGNTDNSEERVRLTADLKVFDMKIEAANAHRDRVSSYRNVVFSNIQRKPEWLEKKETLENEIADIERQIESTLNARKDDVLALESKRMKYEQSRKAVLGDIESVTELDFSGVTSTGEGRIEVVYSAGDLKPKAQLFSDNKHQIEKCWNGAPEVARGDIKGRGIKALVNQLLSCFVEGNHYEFPQVLPEIRADYGILVEKIHGMISSGIHEKEKEIVLSSYKGTMEQLKTGYERMERLRSNLQKTTKGIESIIAKDNFVSAVQSIEFRIALAKNRFSAIRAKVEECCSTLGGLNLASDQEELFRSRPKSSAISHLMDSTAELCDQVEDKNFRHIRLVDLYELEVRVNENGHLSDWNAQVDGIGSNGTDKLIKLMIYIAILSHFRSKAFKNAEEIHLHSLMDENGAIHSEHVSQLLKFCSDRGVFVGTAAPQPHRRPTDFEFAYEMCRSDDGKRATIRTILTQHKTTIDEVAEPAVS